MKPKRRVFTGVIIMFNILMLMWLISAMSSMSNNDPCATSIYHDACQSGADAGTTIGIGVILFFAAAGDIILGVLWHVTRPAADRFAEETAGGERPLTRHQRACPYCAETIQAAAIVCRFCGRDVTPIASEKPPVLPETAAGMVCPSGHNNRVGAKRCDSCGSKFLQLY